MTKTTENYWYQIECPAHYDERHYASRAKAIAAATALSRKLENVQVTKHGISGTCHSWHVVWPNEGELYEEHR